MSEIRPATTNAVAPSQGSIISSATAEASVNTARRAIVIAAAIAPAVTTDLAASSIRRSIGGQYIRLVQSDTITRAAKTSVQETGMAVAAGERCASKSAKNNATTSVASEIRPHDAKRRARRLDRSSDRAAA